MKLIELLRDACARIVAAREAFECGDPELAYSILTDLETDLAGELTTAIAADEPRYCLADFNTIPSRGLRDERTVAWCRAYLDDAA